MQGVQGAVAMLANETRPLAIMARAYLNKKGRSRLGAHKGE